MMAGGFEGENPTRRYKWFRPRQAARGVIYIAATNNGVCGLYNPSSTFYLVVRAVTITGASTGTQQDGIYALRGNPGTAGGVITPLLGPGAAALPGVLWSWDTTTFPTPDCLLTPVLEGATQAEFWVHDFPVAIIPPGDSIANSNINGSGQVQFSAIWEAIYPEELDWLY